MHKGKSRAWYECDAIIANYIAEGCYGESAYNSRFFFTRSYRSPSSNSTAICSRYHNFWYSDNTRVRRRL